MYVYKYVHLHIYGVVIYVKKGVCSVFPPVNGKYRNIDRFNAVYTHSLM